MLKLIVLDWDDCIVRGASEAYYACYAGAIRANGIEVDISEVEKQVRAFWGRPHRQVIASIIGADNMQLDSVVSSYEKLIFTDFFSKHLSLVPGSKEALISLKTKYDLALATGANGNLLRNNLIPYFGMQDIFSSTISSYDLPDRARGKPYPDMLVKLLEKHNVSPAECIMVGDAKGDVLMAQSANVLPIVVLTGQLTRDEAVQLSVQHILPSISDLPALMRSLQEERLPNEL